MKQKLLAKLRERSKNTNVEIKIGAAVWHPKFMLFVGSGFSQSQGGPSWLGLRNLAVSEIAGHLAKPDREKAWEQLAELATNDAKISVEFNAQDMLQKPEFATWVIGESFGGTRQLASFLKRHLLPKPTLLHTITIEKVLENEGIILTTEFDGLFAQTMRYLCPQVGCSLESVPSLSMDSERASPESPRSVRMHKCFGREVLLELHGSVSEPNTLICYPSQVTAWRNHEAAKRTANLLERTDLGIFWGCGGNDDDIIGLFKQMTSVRQAFSRTLILGKVESGKRMVENLRKIPLIESFEFVPCDVLSAEESWRLIDAFIQ